MLIVNLSLNQTVLKFFLCVRQTWKTPLILASSLWEVIFLWSERILILAWSHSLCERRTSFSRDLSLENPADSYLCFWLVLLHSMFYFFFLTESPSSLGMIFDSISSNIDEFLLINLSANVFVFGDFNVHHKDWLLLFWWNWLTWWTLL